MLTDALKRVRGHLAYYAMCGLGGAFVGCLACELYMAWYLSAYELASDSDWLPGLSKWQLELMMRLPKPDRIPWLLSACAIGFAGGVLAGLSFGKPEGQATKPGATPNASPAASLDSSGGTEGPPSVALDHLRRRE